MRGSAVEQRLRERLSACCGPRLNQEALYNHVGLTGQTPTRAPLVKRCDGTFSLHAHLKRSASTNAVSPSMPTLRPTKPLRSTACVPLFQGAAFAPSQRHQGSQTAPETAVGTRATSYASDKPPHRYTACRESPDNTAPPCPPREDRTGMRQRIKVQAPTLQPPQLGVLLTVAVWGV